MDDAQKFDAVRQEIVTLVSNMRYKLDLLEADMEHWRKEGMTCCESHTGSDPIENLEKMQLDIFHAAQFFILMAGYHARIKHWDEMHPLQKALFIAQIGTLEKLFEHQQTTQRGTPKEAEPMTAENWLDRLRKGFKPGEK